MKLVDYANVPICLEAVVTVDLHLIGLTVIVALDHLSSMVYILGVLMPNSFYEDLRCVWQSCHLFDVVFKTFINLQIPLSLDIDLVENDYTQSLRIFGLVNH